MYLNREGSDLTAHLSSLIRVLYSMFCQYILQNKLTASVYQWPWSHCKCTSWSGHYLHMRWGTCSCLAYHMWTVEVKIMLHFSAVCSDLCWSYKQYMYMITPDKELFFQKYWYFSYFSMEIYVMVYQGSGNFEIWIGPADDDDVINEPISKKKYVYITCHEN